MKIGILAIQGAFFEHGKMLDKLGVLNFEIRNAEDLSKNYDGLIIPGGESTTMRKLLVDLKMLETLKKKILEGLPVFGTCAGLILLAKDVANDSSSRGLLTMDIKCKRNAYGRQLGSFSAKSKFANLGEIPMVFIRAPYIQTVKKGVEVLAEVNGKIVAARQKNQLVTAFHPELTNNTTVHKYFLDEIVNKSK